MHAVKNEEVQVEQTEIGPPPLQHRQPRNRTNSNSVIRPLQAKELIRGALAPVPDVQPSKEVSTDDFEFVQQYTHSENFEVDLDQFPAESSVVFKARSFTRGPIERAYDNAQKWYQALRLFYQGKKPVVLEFLRNQVHQARKRYAKLSPRQQQAVAISPYVLAAFTVAFTFTTYGGGKNTSAELKSLPPLKLENIVLTADVGPPAEQVKEKTKKPELTVVAPNKSETQLALQDDNSPYYQFTSRRTWLRSQMKMSSRKVLRLKTNTSLRIHPNFPAKKGWVLAQNKAGHVGFVKSRYLSDTRKKFSRRTR